MSRGTATWLFCTAAVFLLGLFDLDCPRTKQLTLAFGVLVLPKGEEDTESWPIDWLYSCLQYWWIALGISSVLCVFVLARINSLPSSDAPAWRGPGKVLLFPCKTTHARLFPKRHSFAYSYLVVGIPVGWEGNCGGMVSSFPADDANSQTWFSTPRDKAYYHVNPDDYLQRGGGHLGLRRKLDAYLKTQGADPVDYPHAYLVTAARFLGYHFNPVSFWYLYGEDMYLKAMILEVNNTFDERRMYFLTPEAEFEAPRLESSTTSPPEAGQNHRKTPVFKQKWPKDFHVSPFNSRKGSYSLVASDVLYGSTGNQGSPLDNTITLSSSKGHGKIVARLVSEGDAVDPSQMPIDQKLAFLLSWWWVGFVTFPRIVREAGRLWFKRKLHVWFRPEPLKESMGRKADAAEKKLERVFRRYLRSLVKQCQVPLGLKYIPSGIPDSEGELMLSPSAKTNPSGADELDFKVLTPVFYTRFVSYAHDLEALFSELRESCTIWVSRPDLLPKLLFKKPPAALEARSPADYVFFEAIRYLRRRPERIVRPLTSSQSPAQPPTNTSVVDIRDFRISAMDAFVLGQEDKQLRRQYRSLLLRLSIAERCTFGILLPVNLAFLALQTWVACMLALAWSSGMLRTIGIGLAIYLCGFS